MARTRTPAVDGRTSSRRWSDALLVVVGGGVLLLSAIPVHADSLSDTEKSVFQAVNDLPSTIYPVPAWIFMQLGNFLVVPITALVALIARRFRMAATLAVAGLSTYVLAKVVKHFVERGRPSRFVPDLHIRGAPSGGLGYVSGHVAVICALTVAAWPYLGRRARIALVALAGIVGLLRMYVGAHLALDIVGGAGLGVACGGLARLLFGAPRTSATK
jgi:membrane-associated phospholipid phosphatase